MNLPRTSSIRKTSVSDRESKFELSRRHFLGASLAGTAVAALPPFMRKAQADDNVLYVNTWGGNWEKAAQEFLFAPFTHDTGIQIRTVSPISFAKLATQARSGQYEFDVTTLGLAEIARANAANLIEPAQGNIDESKLWPGAVYANGVATHAFANLIAYHKNSFPNGHPHNWADFWDLQTFPGSRSLQRYPVRVLAFALMADGVPPEQLFPYDLDRAFAALDRIKPAIRVWWTQGPQSQQLLRDTEVDMIGIWNDYATNIQESSEQPVEVIWDQALIDKSCWVVAKGTPRAHNAWRLIESIAHNAEGMAKFCAVDESGPLNPEAFAHMDAKSAANAPTNQAHLSKAVVLDGVALLPQLDEIAARFDRWISS
nr:substrate-binding domain-containing protein [Pseudomonas typographi]